MNVDRFVRWIGLILFAIIGWEAVTLIPNVPMSWKSIQFLRYGIPAALIGGVIGYVITPSLTIKPTVAMSKFLHQLPILDLVAGVVGLFIGLLLGALLAVPLSRLPVPFGPVFPIIGSLIFAYLGAAALIIRREDLLHFWSHRGQETMDEFSVLLDTSVIIDGRIADISQTGFLRGRLLVPTFVLNELQYVADSSDALRRNRGRRGLEILHTMQKKHLPYCRVEILNDDVPEISQVDSKLVALGRKFGYPIMTNDYNLNQVAAVQGVEVLNINDLVNAVKTVLLPGETFTVKIIQAGKEVDQGIGYLDDGTMIVVENGLRYLGQERTVLVTKVLQTSAGRMIFAQPRRNHAN